MNILLNEEKKKSSVLVKVCHPTNLFLPLNISGLGFRIANLGLPILFFFYYNLSCNLFLKASL